MANFGNLDEFLEDSDFNFNWGGETITFTAPADKVMKFTVEYQKHNKAEQERLTKIRELTAARKSTAEVPDADRWAEYRMIATLLGGSFSEKTLKFKDCILADMQEADVPSNAINRLVTAITLKYVHGDLTAEHYMLTGDLNEAVVRFSGKAAPKKEYLASLETNQEPGETNTDD